MSHLGTFGLYQDGFMLQRAPAGPSRPQQVLRHTPEPLYVTLGSSIAEGLRATFNIGTHDGWIPNERYGESKSTQCNFEGVCLEFAESDFEGQMLDRHWSARRRFLNASPPFRRITHLSIVPKNFRRGTPPGVFPKFHWNPRRIL